MDNISASGDIRNPETHTTCKQVPKDEEYGKEDSEKLFERFHIKYKHLTSLTSSDKEKTNLVNDEVRITIKSMINELNANLKKISIDHKLYTRFLAMKIFLNHILAKVIDEQETIKLLENSYEEVRPHLMNKEVVYTGFLIMNSLSTLLQKNNGLEKVKNLLEECQSVYNKLKHSNKSEDYYSGKELFSSEIEMISNKEARLKYEKLVITNLLFLGSIYEKLGNHYKDVICYHTAFSRMLNKGLVSPYKWVDFTTRLACVFIDDNNFKDARHHLSAATHVHEILEGKNKLRGDLTVKDLLKNNAIHLALAWVRYCVLLFEKSKDDDRTKFIILYKNGYLFPNKSPTSQVDKSHFSDLLNEKNILLRNQRFMNTIGKELCEHDNDELEEYHDIIRGNIGFGDILNKFESDNSGTKKRDSKSSSSSSGDEPDLNENNSKNDTKEGVLKNKDEAVDKTITKNECDDNEHKDFKSNKVETGDEDENNLVFESLGFLPIEHTVTKDLIENPQEARDLFIFACGWSKQAQMFYPKTKDFYSHIHVMLNMVSLYRLCAYFQGRDNLEYRISLEQTRENILEKLVLELSEVQPESHLHVRLYQEMALLNIDLAMLNMCNIYNIHADDTYKLCALAEIQSHINHTYIVGDMLEKSTELIDKEKHKEPNDLPDEGTPKEKIETN